MKKIKILINIFVLTALLFSCNEVPSHPPEDVLTKEKIVMVMTDIHLLEAYLSTNSLTDNAPLNMSSAAIDSIYKKHSITKSEYNKSIEYYSQHPAEMKEVYDKVLIELTRIQTENLPKK